MPKIDFSTVPVKTGSIYPEPYAAMMAGRSSLRLGDAGGLTQFGANLVILQPGARSSLRHWHLNEDEFVMVTQGECTMMQDAGPTLMRTGDCAAFKAGDADGHCFVNHTDAEARFLVVGSKAAREVATYSDVDLVLTVEAGKATYAYKDGSAFKGPRMIIDSASPEARHTESGVETIRLSDAAGLTQFGVYRETLPPGTQSSERHWHEAEDEFLYVLEGVATVIDDDGAHHLRPGDAACWRHGDPKGHHVKNLTDTPVVYLIAGSRVALDVCHYPDSGQTLVNSATDWQVLNDKGEVERHGALPPELLDLQPVWGEGFDAGKPARRILRQGTVESTGDSGSSDALPDLGEYRAFPISDAGGLTQFGAFTEILMPGAQSSHRHWHEAEDEFVYFLDGDVTLVENDGEHLLHPGDSAGWAKGIANAHCLRNHSDRPVTYFVVGSRMPDDTCHYPDIDLHYTRRDGVRTKAHKDGTPYPGWPKGA